LLAYASVFFRNSSICNITSDVEVIPFQEVNEAYGRLLKDDVKYRFTIGMASLRA
jgi:uncharacterized zinc-type alcohol dehydrogenase-like protein